MIKLVIENWEDRETKSFIEQWGRDAAYYSLYTYDRDKYGDGVVHEFDSMQEFSDFYDELMDNIDGLCVDGGSDIMKDDFLTISSVYPDGDHMVIVIETKVVKKLNDEFYKRCFKN